MKYNPFKNLFNFLGAQIPVSGDNRNLVKEAYFSSLRNILPIKSENERRMGPKSGRE